ncbi:MAG: hypothetical protein COV52_09290 [Gammaproteobacteria bacterium CG11_big_fil_rev_8_21_14_0_20_46_22]|nr:MAG: hypothetical protein COW05_07030 [Gammaproteobacteria bacterium CG12_big_fil_rev_8_21_14_0_65_46_12]PIR10325.1 MAG: hypothetical protein COV52_09290 [Gammaproteobacteria bacterium CG11_big_fil_rev_8_21_14_0_20_46_22]
MKNATTAMCACPVVKSKSFSITGPGDAQKCVTQPHQIWSAISIKDASGNSNFVGALYQKTFPDSPIVTSGS